MAIRTVTKDWDWKFGHGISDYANRSIEVAYSVKMRILSWYRDCFFAANEGIDWKNLLGEKILKEEVDKAVNAVIVNTEGVQSISNFQSDVVDRVYTLSARIKTIYGETIEVRI